ncbi:MAG: hypothetical protein CM1200mP29_10270 [Verrucomicrobiota bacterium]|nr:MAG: hypothetical protein CM1200mP29_10270 [Verrucomicrobiota bacterium]
MGFMNFSRINKWIVTFLRRHPRLRSHEPITLGKRLEHRIGINPEFELPVPKAALWAGLESSITTMAVDAEVIVNSLTFDEILGAELFQNPSVIDCVGFIFCFLPKDRVGQNNKTKNRSNNKGVHAQVVLFERFIV